MQMVASQTNAFEPHHPPDNADIFFRTRGLLPPPDVTGLRPLATSGAKIIDSF
jgi:hypothetical protein